MTKNSLEISVISGPVAGSIRPPGSKSLTNRALVLSALAHGPSQLSGVLDSEDTRVMVAAWRQLGIDCEVNWDQEQARVVGCGGQLPAQELVVEVANSGTTLRFLTAALATLHGKFRLQGVPRMHERPIGDLVAALQKMGVSIQALSPGNCPPVEIRARGLPGGTVSVRGDMSSQYLSGLLMAAPLARGPVEIRLEGTLVSQPYVEMTLAQMRSFGVEVLVDSEFKRFSIEPQGYRGTICEIEPDASAASYFFAAAAICGGSGRVEGLSQDSLQGDLRFVDVLERMGCRVKWGSNFVEVLGPATRAIDVQMTDLSDTVQTLAVVALHVPGTTRITGVAHNRLKETDRIRDLSHELRKLGGKVVELPDGLVITSPTHLRAAELETYRDHRMAMSLALAGLKTPGVRIQEPECVVKTYPNFFRDLNKFCR